MFAIESKYYSASMLKARPNDVFIFGDNMIRQGKRGQAIIRDEINSLGLSTKRFPALLDGAFYSDKQDEIEFTEKELTRLEHMMKNAPDNAVFVLPKEGIGTGLAALPTRSPKVWRMYQAWFSERGVKLTQAGFSFK